MSSTGTEAAAGAGSDSSNDTEAGDDGALVDAYEALLFDLDGVLYRATDTVPGAPEAIAGVRDRGKRLAFVTNNSSRTPEQVAEKLRGHGIDARPEEVVSSAMATADLLRERGGGTAYVIGETGIREALRQAGLKVVTDDAQQADHVVVGVDTDVTYANLRTAALLVQRGASLVATNADASYPAPNGLWPGAGALLAAITTTLGRGPDDVVGKPHPPLLLKARDLAGGGAALVVGDRLDTDVDGAAAVGWDSLMVLTGVSAERDLIGAPTVPTFLGTDLAALFRPAPAIGAALEEDAGPIERLLIAAGLESDGVAGRIPDTLVARTGGGDVVGTAALELFPAPGGGAGTDADGRAPVAHLRSLAVDERRRGSHLGTLLVARVVRLALDRGAASIHLVTETAAPFFERLGFEATGRRDTLPGPILATPMVRDACSVSSTAFRWAPPAPRRG